LAILVCATQPGRADDPNIHAKLKALAVERPRFGYRRPGVMLERKEFEEELKRLRRLKDGNRQKGS
jgi:hypothetical protein